MSVTVKARGAGLGRIAGSGGTIGIDALSWKCGCVGIGRRRQPANRMGNTVEPGDEKPGQRQRTGKEKRGFPGKMFFLYKVVDLPRDFS